MTFIQRLITTQLVLGQPSTSVAPGSTSSNSGSPGFVGPNGTSGNTLTLSGLRTSVDMKFAGAAKLTSAQIMIYGMTEDQMNAASTYAAFPNIIRGGQVFVYTGDNVQGMRLAFSGNVIVAAADFNSQPDVPFIVSAASGVSAQMLVIPPTSAPGPTEAASLLKALANQCGYSFENNSGATSKISNPYFRGSPLDQIRKICEAANFNFTIENNQTLAIWPSGQARNTGGQSVSLSYADGSLIGYPVFANASISAKCLYDPNIRYGAIVSLKSHIPQANGSWYLYGIDTSIKGNWPDGEWFSTLHLAATANAQP